MICPSCNQNLTEKTNYCPKCGLVAPWADEFANELSFYKWTSNLYSIELKLGSIIKQDSIVHKKAETFQPVNSDPSLASYAIRFGTDKQGQKITWKILGKSKQKALIISNDIICNKPYNTLSGNTFWKNSSLRSWLNNEFLNEYFNEDERTRIIPFMPKDKGTDNSEFSRRGIPEGDKVFLLSKDEALRFFKDNAARTLDSWWWLRSSGNKPEYAAYIRSNGVINNEGADTYYIGGVRPAMWISLGN